MKMMKRLTTLALVLVLALSLCACGAKPEQALMGTWRYDFDYTNTVTDEMPADMAAYMPQEAKLVMPIYFTFKENMTYTVAIDSDATIASINAYMDELISGMIEMMYVTGEEEGIDREAMDALVMEMSGTDMETYCRQMMEESMDMDGLMEELAVEERGDWKVSDGRLYLDENDAGFSENGFLLYTVTEDALTFTANDNDLMSLSEVDMEYPMVLTKQP